MTSAVSSQQCLLSWPRKKSGYCDTVAVLRLIKVYSLIQELYVCSVLDSVQSGI